MFLRVLRLVFGVPTILLGVLLGLFAIFGFLTDPSSGGRATAIAIGVIALMLLAVGIKLCKSSRKVTQPVAQLLPQGPRRKSMYSRAEMQTVGFCAQRLSDVIYESMKLAKESHEPVTKLSRLDFAKQKLEEIKALVNEYPFLELPNLANIEISIARMEMEFEQAGIREVADGNLRGDSLEKQGKPDQAIAEYERLLTKGVDTPFTYRRLAILYRRMKQPESELRVVRAALSNVPRSNAGHYAWFEERFSKIQQR